MDIVEIARMERLCARWQEHFIEKIFAPEEIQYCNKKAKPAASFAARFAAKEAFAKAMGTGIGKHMGWKDFWIEIANSGEPVARLSPKLQELIEESNVHITLSHAESYAVATVIIER